MQRGQRRAVFAARDGLRLSLRVLRRSERAFPEKRGSFGRLSVSRQEPHRVLTENQWRTDRSRYSEIRVSDVRASSLDRSLVGQACVARTRLRVDLRDSSGRQARERFLRR